MTPSQQPSPPPCDANVAGSDSGESPTTNKACPAGFDKLDDSGRGGFPDNIETEWLRYLTFQEERLVAAGEKYPTVYLSSSGIGHASGLNTPIGSETKGPSLHEAVTNRLKLIAEKGPNLAKQERIEKLQAELASLKGEGVGA